MIDTASPANRGILRYLSRSGKSENIILTTPESVLHPYLCQGSHPDIVQRVWDELGSAIPEKCRCLVYGTPALVHDVSGIVLAIGNGTQYNLRLTSDDFQRAITIGASTRTRWSSGEEMDSLEELGPDWIFGGWLQEEIPFQVVSQERK
jgi:hypothetical protein